MRARSGSSAPPPSSRAYAPRPDSPAGDGHRRRYARLMIARRSARSSAARQAPHWGRRDTVVVQGESQDGRRRVRTAHLARARHGFPGHLPRRFESRAQTQFAGPQIAGDARALDRFPAAICDPLHHGRIDQRPIPWDALVDRHGGDEAPRRAHRHADDRAYLGLPVRVTDGCGTGVGVAVRDDAGSPARISRRHSSPNWAKRYRPYDARDVVGVIAGQVEGILVPLHIHVRAAVGEQMPSQEPAVQPCGSPLPDPPAGACHRPSSRGTRHRARCSVEKPHGPCVRKVAVFPSKPPAPPVSWGTRKRDSSFYPRRGSAGTTLLVQATCPRVSLGMRHAPSLGCTSPPFRVLLG